MPKKTVIGELEGERLIVENTWFSGIRLFHGEKMIGVNNQIFSVSKDSPLIRKEIVVGGVSRLVEVFAVALLTVKIQLKVDGQHLAGHRL
ncbi:hypothetical protein ACNKU7_14555 [Microbulbifer sp. SA54]|uniref:hypothetical protein n=1 Tax=Microbulbifer sp. SA54 TaxID=3401577 RepID=UPI003AAF4E28